MTGVVFGSEVLMAKLGSGGEVNAGVALIFQGLWRGGFPGRREGRLALKIREHRIWGPQPPIPLALGGVIILFRR